ncbi:MAG: glutamate-1-semialdehyde 2,1-aminomutase, partial [Deltaproteobacteria bacterium]|nr:glutamate-1-semialdehyde 2,1-aminomutase [Deltaproteobacteria bacterium]
MADLDRSRSLFQQAKSFFPGGVNSPVRAFKAVGGTPLFFQRGEGAYLFDEDGRKYVDFVCSWGPLILGYGHPQIREAIDVAMRNGTSFGAPCANEIQLARHIRDGFPHMEKMRMVSSGTEAAMTAIRLARAFTGRDMIIKFAGCYHGHSDSLLVKAGSGAGTLGIPASAGVPEALAQLTLTATYNDSASVKRLVAAHPGKIAGIIVEPVAGNMGVVPPMPGFLETLRSLCTKYGIVLIFDEVMTGFRISFGGAQARFGITPDMTVLGKIVGGGMPLAAFGGRKDIMESLAPLGPVYQAGTLSGHPLACAAGLAALTYLRNNPNVYAELEGKSSFLEKAFVQAIAEFDIPATVQRSRSMMTIFCSPHKITDFDKATQCDTEL